MIRFCYDPFLFHRCYPFTLLRFCAKTEEQTFVLSAYIDPSDNKYGLIDFDFIFFTHGSPSVRITDLQGAMLKTYNN